LTEITVTPAEKRLILTASMLVLLLGALDQTIVSTAMPRIIEQLRGLEMYAWVTTAYMLTSTVAVPIYGKLSDMFGRKPILVLGLLVFLAGSALCGMSGEFGDLPVLGSGMTQLIVFRAVQGIGGGALMTSAFAVIADLYPPRERGRMFGLFGAVFGLATIIGPFIGGFFTDHGTVTLFGYEVAGWRWIFYVNLPLGLLALFMILRRMPLIRHRGAGRVDYLGAVLVVTTLVPLLLALSLGGTRYAWDSGRIVGLFVASGVSLIVFLWVESRAADAILPLRLFRVRTFRVATLGSFVVNMAFLGVVMFMPLYMQVVQGINATQSGLALLPLMGALIVSTTVSGRLVTRTGRYKPFMVGGGVILLVGVISLTGIRSDTSTLDLAWRLALTGIGLGPAQGLFNLVIQNAVPIEDLGTATSMSQFSRQLGSTVGVALFGTFFTNSLTAELPRHTPLMPGAIEHRIDLSHAQAQAMDESRVRELVRSALDERYAVIERAYRQDADAVAEILADPRIPEDVKSGLRDGGIHGRIHRKLEQRAAEVEAEIESGQAGRDRLLESSDLSQKLKAQLANIPERALRDPALRAEVADLFRNAILAQEETMVSRATERSLQVIRDALASYAEQLIARTRQGIREAFSISIADMLRRSVWIVALGLAIVLLIPEIPLRGRTSAVRADEP
jgi:EmrB/QacA subfamily drug resistance transporter